MTWGAVLQAFFKQEDTISVKPLAPHFLKVHYCPSEPLPPSRLYPSQLAQPVTRIKAHTGEAQPSL